jgi:hypothetical protein
VYVLSTKGNLKACFFHFRTDTLADKVYFDPPMNIRSLTSTETGLVFLQLGEGKFWNDNICEDNLYLAQSRRERQEFLNQYLKLTDFDLNMLKTLGEEYVSDKRQRFKDLQQAKRTGWLSNYQQKMIEGFEKSGLRCFVDLEVN